MPMIVRSDHFFHLLNFLFYFMEIWHKIAENKSEFVFAISIFLNVMKESLIVKSPFFRTGGNCV